MGTKGCHSNQRSYPTGIKNIIIVPLTYRCCVSNMDRIGLTASKEYVVWKCWPTSDGRRMPVYTISSPTSLWLWWAKKASCNRKSLNKFLICPQCNTFFFNVQWISEKRFEISCQKFAYYQTHFVLEILLCFNPKNYNGWNNSNVCLSFFIDNLQFVKHVSLTSIFWWTVYTLTDSHSSNVTRLTLISCC